MEMSHYSNPESRSGSANNADSGNLTPPEEPDGGSTSLHAPSSPTPSADVTIQQLDFTANLIKLRIQKGHAKEAGELAQLLFDALRAYPEHLPVSPQAMPPQEMERLFTAASVGFATAKLLSQAQLVEDTFVRVFDKGPDGDLAPLSRSYLRVARYCMQEGNQHRALLKASIALDVALEAERRGENTTQLVRSISTILNKLIQRSEVRDAAWRRKLHGAIFHSH